MTSSPAGDGPSDGRPETTTLAGARRTVGSPGPAPVLVDRPSDEPAFSVEATRLRFPSRPRPVAWPHTCQDAPAILQRLDTRPLRADNPGTHKVRRLGVDRCLTWLASFPGTSWQPLTFQLLSDWRCMA